MGLLKKYDPKKVVITWGNLLLNSGIIDGSFVTVSRTSRNSSLNVGADGRGTMVINNDKSAAITVSLRGGSDVNDSLSDIVLNDETDNDEKLVAPLTIRDFTGRTLLTSDEVFLDGPPDVEYATDESENTWTLMGLQVIMDVRGNNEAA